MAGDQQSRYYNPLQSLFLHELSSSLSTTALALDKAGLQAECPGVPQVISEEKRSRCARKRNGSDLFGGRRRLVRSEQPFLASKSCSRVTGACTTAPLRSLSGIRRDLRRPC